MEKELNICEDRLCQLVRRSKKDDQLVITEWSYSRLGWKVLNNVTGGVYRVEGAAVSKNKPVSWSFILKIVLPSSDTNDPGHYNYWKREILAYQSGLLDKLPSMIRAPRCFGIEQQGDGTVWIWLEEVFDHAKGEWTLKDCKDTAHLLGRFNGTYLVDKRLPSESWLCQGWLSSWVEECDKYDDGTALNESTWKNNNIKELFPSDMFQRYKDFHQKRMQLLEGLDQLPKVFTHNDAWPPNLFRQNNGGIVAIDWAFAGIAGVGEEAGRFYGLLLHSDLILLNDKRKLADVLFEGYDQGLNKAGWTGDIRLARFGFAASAGIRCGMLVPKLLEEVRKSKDKLKDQCENAVILLELAEEAITLLSELSLCEEK